MRTATTPGVRQVLPRVRCGLSLNGACTLARENLVQSHPNPLTEGMFKFYGSEMLKDAGLYEQVPGKT